MVGTPSASLPPSLVAARNPLPDPAEQQKFMALAKKVKDLEELVKKLQGALALVTDDSTWFSATVLGGSDKKVKLYATIPEPGDGQAPAAKADLGRTLRLSYPRVSKEVDGVAHTWYRVHTIDRTTATADFNRYWVSDRASDGSPAFSKFDVITRVE